MRVFSCDANILIDLEEGEVLDFLFQLPHRFLVPDILFAEELEEQHRHLLDLGLGLGELSPESMSDTEELIRRYGESCSRNDCFVLALARQEQCVLLTGDQDLRNAAEAESTPVRGTIWVIEHLIKHRIITKQRALSAYQAMQKEGRRLPWDLAYRRLESLQRARS